MNTVNRFIDNSLYIPHFNKTYLFKYEINKARNSSRIFPLKQLSKRIKYRLCKDDELKLFLNTYDNIYVITPENGFNSIYPYPFIYFKSAKYFEVSGNIDNKIYIPLHLITKYHIDLLKNILRFEIKCLYNYLNVDETIKKQIAEKIYSIWAINDGIKFYGKSKAYADTCRYIVSSHFEYNFINTTKGVIDPVARAVFLKSKVVIHYLKKGFKLIDNDLYTGNLEWFDAILQDKFHKKQLIHLHQGFFHEGLPLSEITESMWRLGTGTLKIILQYIRLSITSLNNIPVTSTLLQIKNDLNAILQIFLNELIPLSEKRILTHSILKEILKISPNGTQFMTYIEFLVKLTRKGWLCNLINRVSLYKVKVKFGYFDSCIIYIDTRFDQIKYQLDRDTFMVEKLKNGLDPIGRDLAEFYLNGKDYIWSLIQNRLSEIKAEGTDLSNIQFKNVSELNPNLSPNTIRIELNSLLRENPALKYNLTKSKNARNREFYFKIHKTKNHFIDACYPIIEGVIYSRYCGLLLELAAIDYFLKRGFEVLQSGIEITDENGMYKTELDIVLKNPFSGKFAICEVKSMRTRMSGNKALKIKLFYKLETYKNNLTIIEKSLGIHIDEVYFVVDVGRQTKLKDFFLSQENDLKNKFGFPIKIVNINMGDIVKSVTGYEALLNEREKNRDGKIVIMKKCFRHLSKNKNRNINIKQNHLPVMSQSMRKFMNSITSEERQYIIDSIYCHNY